jgi:hypothetical protein
MELIKRKIKVKQYGNGFFRIGKQHICFLLAFTLPAFIICPQGLSQETETAPALITGLSPVNPQPPAASLKPGLSALYIYEFIRHLDNMPTGDRARKKGKPGPPILILNHQFDEGVVFDSGKTRGVCVQMTGYINFPQPGRYIFMAQSNDGIRIYINDQIIINDPEVHSDQFSPKTIVEITRPGRYQFRVRYFQRKGTAMLKLYWQDPGNNDFRIVPAEAYAH